MNDGTFGVTADVSALDPEVVARIETHDFQPLKSLYWRNKDLTFVTVQSLLSGLNKGSSKKELIKPPMAEDQRCLEILAKDADVKARAKGKARVRLLWDVAQVPDFRKLRPENHARLLQQVYQHLTQDAETLPEDWISKQVKRLDRTDGDIHTLMDRIAAIRTWTYLANRPRWMTNPGTWQAETRAVEDRLSDALHDKLTRQFIDRRTAHLMKKLKGDNRLEAFVDEDGRVSVDGHFIGHMDGLMFNADRTGFRTADRAVASAADTALIPELAKRVKLQLAAEDDAFNIDDAGAVLWQGATIGRLKKGPDVLRPRVELRADSRLDSELKLKISDHLQAWSERQISSKLGAIVQTDKLLLSGAARGLAYQIAEALGSTSRQNAENQVKTLSEDDHKAMTRAGIRFGIEFLYVPELLKAEPIRLRAILWSIYYRLDPRPDPPPAGRVSFPTVKETPAGFYLACGFKPVKGTAYRVDMVERFAADVRRLLRDDVKYLPPSHLSPLGIGAETAIDLLKALGFNASIKEEGISIATKRKPMKPKPKGPAKKKQQAKIVNPDSPFAKLKDLVPLD